MAGSPLVPGRCNNLTLPVIAQLESARMSHKADVQGVVQQLKA